MNASEIDSCMYDLFCFVLVDHSPTIVMGEDETLNVIAKVLLSVKKVSSESSSRTAFFVGLGRKKTDSKGVPKPLWVTARHGGMVEGVVGELHLNNKGPINFTCVWDDPLCDLAVLASEDIASVTLASLDFSTQIRQAQSVVIAGFGDWLAAGEPLHPSTKTVHIALVSATQVLNSEDSGEDVEWTCGRFFVVDSSVDYGYSGSPVFNKLGQVVGMLCSSQAAPDDVSNCLRAGTLDEQLKKEFVFNRKRLLT